MGAHTFYVPAQLFETADGLPRAVRDPRRVLAPAVRRGSASPGGPTTRASPPCTPASSTGMSCSPRSVRACGRRSATEWAERLRPLGIAVGAVVDLAAALDGELVRSRGMVVTIDTPAGPLRLVGHPRPLRRRAVPTTARRPASTSTPPTCWTPRCVSPADHIRRRYASARTGGVRRRSRRRRAAAGGEGLAGEDPALVDLLGGERVVHAHRHRALVEVRHAGRAASRPRTRTAG